MKVMVIGGAGYIGSHVVRELLDQNHTVLVFDNLSTGLRGNLQVGAQFVYGDILDESHLRTQVQAFSPQAVVHLAAFKAAGESMIVPQKYSRNNINGSLNVLNACSDFGVSYFVFSSSAAVYGAPQYLPVDEQHPQKPENYYGFTKLTLEQYMQWYDSLKGLRFAALRYFNAAGYDVQGRLYGLEQNPANLLPIVMEVAAGTRKQLMIFGNDYDTPDGTGVRDYIHVNDLAKGHVQALDYLQAQNKSITVNLGTGMGYSVLDVVKMTEKITGRTIPYEIVERRAGDPASLLAKSNSALSLLGWKAQYSDLETILQTTWQAYQKNQV
jgi:UDP-glucose 4-epimerase